MARFRLLLAVGFALSAGGATFLITTAPGPGLDPDAMAYLGAAESLRAHGTLRVPVAGWSSADSTSPLGHFPSGFPVAIAVVAAALSPIQAARAVEVASAAVMAGAGVWLAAAEAGTAAGALLGVLLFVSQPLATDHVRIVSEPLFLALLVVTLALLRLAPRRPLVWGVAASLAVTVRYVGLALVAAVGIVAWLETGERRARLRAVSLAAGPGLLAHGLWTLRSHLEYVDVRTLSINRGLGTALREGLDTSVAWLAPVGAAPAVRAAIAFAVVGALGLLVRRTAREALGLYRCLAIVIVCYAGLVLVSRVAADPDIPFDDRMLSPMFLLGALGLAVGFAAAWRRWNGPARAVAALALALWMGAGMLATARFVRVAREGGWGYANDEWHSSPLVEWLAAEGPRRALFTNNAAGVYFALHRPSRGLPETLQPDELAGFAEVLERSRGLLVQFREGYDNEVGADEVARRLGLVELARSDLGVVWGLREVGPGPR